MFIEIKAAKKQYGTGEAAVYALDGVDFSLEKGKLCVILGPSGFGKSTLLNMIGGLDSLDSGEITVDGQKITGLSKKALITTASYIISLLLLRRKVDRTDLIEALKDGRE